MRRQVSGSIPAMGRNRFASFFSVAIVYLGVPKSSAEVLFENLIFHFFDLRSETWISGLHRFENLIFGHSIEHTIIELVRSSLEVNPL